MIKISLSRARKTYSVKNLYFSMQNDLIKQLCTVDYCTLISSYRLFRIMRLLLLYNLIECIPPVDKKKFRLTIYLSCWIQGRFQDLLQCLKSFSLIYACYFRFWNGTNMKVSWLIDWLIVWLVIKPCRLYLNITAVSKLYRSV